jgi:glycosyltransferase involved in cell wall biosynthesis
VSSPDIRHRFGDREAVAYRPFVNVSIVMPAHNEEVLLPASVDDVCRGLRSRGTRFELLVVENGSTDRTLGLAHELATANDEVRVLTRPEADYGAALRLGLLEATGDVVVNFDVDYYDLAFLDTAVTALGGPPAPAIVVGSKRAPGAHDRRSWPRRFVTWGFTTLLRMMFHIGVSDTHGMKAMARARVAEIARRCRFDADLFDTELVIRVERAGMSVTEIPVTVTERRPSRTSILRRVPRSLWGLVRLRIALSRERTRA